MSGHVRRWTGRLVGAGGSTMHLSIGPRMLRGLSATTQLALAAPLLRDRTTHDRHLAHGGRAPSRVAGDGGSSPDRGYIQMSAPETQRGDAAPHGLSLSAMTVAHFARGWPRAGTRPVGDLAGSSRWIQSTQRHHVPILLREHATAGRGRSAPG